VSTIVLLIGFYAGAGLVLLAWFISAVFMRSGRYKPQHD